MPNRLSRESSPYLLQHQHNPVDWYPWGEEAFARARDEDRPIFLSVGYSTCHWCHVMERESFERDEVADVLNRSFVSIKVDREERPDVDRVYMAFVQATTGAGGWPMSVWLTPALEPFYGGTYFPPTSRWGRPGFVEILEEIARVWRDDRAAVVRSAAGIVARLREASVSRGGARPPGVEVLASAVREFAAVFDAARGGFGGAPMFPRPGELFFLLREYARTADAEPRDMALRTLRAMASGGMRDHIGGGFHRYSVDADWRVPHFEKMLYDQAQLALAFLEGAQASGDPALLEVALDTLDYVARDMRHAEGGFFSAEDADSVPPAQAGDPRAPQVEGAFYAWTDAEIGEVLGAAADLFRMRWGVRAEGNVASDPHGEFRGTNLLYAAQALEAIAQVAGQPVHAVESALARAREALFERRNSRPRPHLDDKVITAWNGLMIAAFARAARLMRGEEDETARARERRYLETAQQAVRFVRRHLWRARDRTLLRRFRGGDAGVEAYAEDYAYLIFGLLELFQADGDPGLLEWALDLQARMDERFWDASNGGWFSTAGDDPAVLLRLKEEYDGAEPSASAIGAWNLLVLSHLSPDAATTNGAAAAARIEQTFAAFASIAMRSGRAIPVLLSALSSYHAGVSQLVVVGRTDEEPARALWDVVASRYEPFTIVIPLVPAHQAAMEQLLPWVTPLGARGGEGTAFLCRGFACDMPARNATELRARFDAAGGPGETKRS